MAVSHSLAVIKLQQPNYSPSRRPMKGTAGKGAVMTGEALLFSPPDDVSQAFSPFAQGMMELRCEMGACACLQKPVGPSLVRGNAMPDLGSTTCWISQGLQVVEPEPALSSLRLSHARGRKTWPRNHLVTS